MPPNVLEIIANNPALTDALRAVIEKHFSADDLSEKMTNEELGENVRARVQGLDRISRAFNEIAKYKKVEEKDKGQNPAR